MLAVDLSNYSGPLSPVQVAALKASGAYPIVGLQFPGPGYPPGCADQQIGALLAGGFTSLDVYFESTDPRTAWAKVSQYRGHVRQAWLAVEDDSGFTTEGQIDDALVYIDSQLSSLCGIYTSAVMWAKYVPNLTKYARRPLWNADYNGQQSLALPAPYGGWTVATMHQYAGSQTFATIPNVDIDYMEDTVAQSPPMTEADVTAIYKKVLGVESPGVDIAPQEEQESPPRRVYLVTLPVGQ